MDKIYLKSLSGDIIDISLTPFFGYKSWDKWNRIISVIACENNCSDYQVVIFDNESIHDKENIYQLPDLIPNKQYNFLIRDLSANNFTTSIVSYPNYNYKKFSIVVNYDDYIQTFNVYEKGNFFYHEKDVLVNDSFIKIKYPEEGLCSMYSILFESLLVPWYDKQYVTDKIMLDYITNKDDDDYE